MQSLTDILIEELHDHLYLKSPYCQGRWKAFSPNGVDAANNGQELASSSMQIDPTSLDSSVFTKK